MLELGVKEAVEALCTGNITAEAYATALLKQAETIDCLNAYAELQPEKVKFAVIFNFFAYNAQQGPCKATAYTTLRKHGPVVDALIFIVSSCPSVSAPAYVHRPIDGC